jgi:ABC-2 type transport system ATP-binding protein
VTTFSDPAIAVSGLAKSFGSHSVLADIGLNVTAGTVFSLLNSPSTHRIWTTSSSPSPAQLSAGSAASP